MRALASLVFDTIYFDTDRAASFHLEGAWIGKVNWYAKAADGGGDDGAADAKPGGDDGAADANRAGEQHQHRDRGTFEGTGKKQLGGWLQSLGETKTALSQKAVIYLSNEAHRCLIAVGDTPQAGRLARLRSASLRTQTHGLATRRQGMRCGENMAMMTSPAAS